MKLLEWNVEVLIRKLELLANSTCRFSCISPSCGISCCMYFNFIFTQKCMQTTLIENLFFVNKSMPCSLLIIDHNRNFSTKCTFPYMNRASKVLQQVTKPSNAKNWLQTIHVCIKVIRNPCTFLHIFQALLISKRLFEVCLELVIAFYWKIVRLGIKTKFFLPPPEF